MDSTSAIISVILFILFFVFIVPSVIGLWGIFKKAGVEGWKSLVPVYNLLVLLKIVGKPAWWTLLITSQYIFMILWLVMGGSRTGSIYTVTKFSCSMLALVYVVWLLNMLSKSFGKDEAFTVGLTFLSFVFLPILGFGNARYEGPYGNPELFEEYKAGKNGGFDFEKDILAS